MHYLNLKPKNKTDIFKKSIIQFGYALKTLFKISTYAIAHPISLAKKINLKKINVLIRALKYESPKIIITNFNRFLTEGNIHEFKEDEAIFPTYKKEDHLRLKKEALKQFLDSESHIDFTYKHPLISIVIILYNQAELSLACLKSLQKHAAVPIELILVDNNSTDETAQLLDRIKGAKIIRNKKNLHFIKACNQAIEKINCDYLLFLNNDTKVFEKTISSALQTLNDNKRCGAVGGKIILPNAKLQEAGNIIWNDGSCLGYGRNKAHYLPEYNFKRVVDYCSAAFLLTKTTLFKKHGGFDTRFEPAYYEETDYCLWLQKQGMEVIYDPKAVIRHFEFGSGIPKNVLALQHINQAKFYAKHKDQLKHHLPPDSSKTIIARHAASKHPKQKILYIDDRIPHADLGSGLPRANTIIHCLHKLGYQITICPLIFSGEGNWDKAYRDINPSIELIRGFETTHFNTFIQERSDYYNYVWISRFHNLNSLKSILQKHASNCKIIYDAEAIITDREIERLKIEGFKADKNRIKAAQKKELFPSEIVDLTLTVSKADANRFSEFGAKNIKILGHSVNIRTTNIEFSDRKDLLFVGNLNDGFSPNADSIRWFVNEVFSIVKSSIPAIKLNIVGDCKNEFIASLKSENIIFHGKQKFVTEFYDNKRIFIAPTRFAAGIPYKIHEAAANGIPVVATEILGKQLKWKHKDSIILSEPDPEIFAKALIELYNTPELWKSIQENAYKIVKNELSLSSYKKLISEIIESA